MIHDQPLLARWVAGCAAAGLFIGVVGNDDTSLVNWSIGLVLGVMQYLALFRFLPSSWVPVTALAWAIGWGVLIPFDEPISAIFDPTGETAAEIIFNDTLLALAMGLAQWPLLKGKIRRAMLWPVASTAAGFAEGIVFVALSGPHSLLFELPFYMAWVFVEVGAWATFGLISGLALWRLQAAPKAARKAKPKP